MQSAHAIAAVTLIALVVLPALTKAQDFIKPADLKPRASALGLKFKQVDDRTWALIFSTGDEIFSGLTQFAIDHRIKSAHLTAIGAWRSAVLGYYDLERQQYRKIEIKQQVELLSLIGDFALDKSKPALHAHALVGLPDGTTKGGHLIEAYASPTTEVFLVTSTSELTKKYDRTSSLDLIAPTQK